MRVLLLASPDQLHYLVPPLASRGLDITVLLYGRVEGELQLPGIEAELMWVHHPLVECLRRARIEEADAFLSLSPDDNLNAMTSLIASRIYRIQRTLCSIENPRRYEAYRRLGLNVICTTQVLVDQALSTVEG